MEALITIVAFNAGDILIRYLGQQLYLNISGTVMSVDPTLCYFEKLIFPVSHDFSLNDPFLILKVFLIEIELLQHAQKRTATVYADLLHITGLL